MARYANHECAGCGEILPAYELERVEDTVETGTSRTSRRIGHTPNFRHTSTTKHYAKRGKLLCGPCRSKRAIGKVVTFVGGAALLLVIIPKGPPSSPTPAGSQVVDTSPIMPQKQDEVNAPGAADTDDRPRSAEPTERRADSPASEDVVPDAVNSAAGPSERETVAARLVAAPSSIDRVHQAMQEALERGKARRWHSDHLHGWAVPSAAASDGCRMMQVSIDGGAQSAPERMCPTAAPL